MTILEAREAALGFARTVKHDKRDPRDIDRQASEARAKAESDHAARLEEAAIAAAKKSQADAMASAEKERADKLAPVTVGEVWRAYIAERTPFWGAALMPMALKDLDHHLACSRSGANVTAVRSAAKQLRMRPGTHKVDDVALHLVNQQEVATDMTLPLISPLTFQCVVQPLDP